MKVSIRVYKPSKCKGLWRYSLRRIVQDDKWGWEEYFSKDGTWSRDAMEIKQFRSEEAAKAVKNWFDSLKQGEN